MTLQTRYPSFFDEALRLVMYDPLGACLGATKDGLLEYRYLDAVKLTGHSCPTVAGAYLTTLRALRRLYGHAIPVRGDIDVRLAQEAPEGVAGVVASVASLLTGAVGDGGFKGIGGRFGRRLLLGFGADIDGDIRFRRCDTGAGVVARMNAAALPPAAEARHLLRRVLANEATPAEAAEFRRLWQRRVRELLVNHADDPDLILLAPLP